MDDVWESARRSKSEEMLASTREFFALAPAASYDPTRADFAWAFLFAFRAGAIWAVTGEDVLP